MVNSLVSTPGPEEVAARLRAAAASAPKGSVALLPGLTDEELDSWEAPVPEEIRILLRRTSGLRITSGVREKHFGPAHPVNSAPEDPNHLCSGDPGTFRVVHVDDGTGDTYYVDVDPATGAWGRVFSFHVEVISEVVAPSLLHWLEDLSDYVSRASSETAKGYFTSFREAFNAWFFGDFSEAGPGYPHQDPAVLARQREPVDVDPLDVPTAPRPARPRPRRGRPASPGQSPARRPARRPGTGLDPLRGPPRLVPARGTLPPLPRQRLPRRDPMAGIGPEQTNHRIAGAGGTALPRPSAGAAGSASLLPKRSGKRSQPLTSVRSSHSTPNPDFRSETEHFHSQWSAAAVHRSSGGPGSPSES
ncbi:hypothetical protein ABH917_003740 [Thermobifida halotolerans]